MGGIPKHEELILVKLYRSLIVPDVLLLLLLSVCLSLPVCLCLCLSLSPSLSLSVSLSLCDNFDIIICGDLSAWTLRMELLTCWLTPCVLTVCVSRRESHEIQQKNVFGNQLVDDLCSTFNCSIVKGLCDRVWITYISSTGSVIDHIIMSNDLFSVKRVSSFEITFSCRVQPLTGFRLCTCKS